MCAQALIPERYFSRFCLALVLVAAFFLYFYRLDHESLLTDEYLSLHVAQHSPRDIVFNHRAPYNPNTMPPLYEVLLHFWLGIFGTAEAAQRSLSALLGVLSVYMMHRIGRMLCDVKTGIVSALFSALSFSWFFCFRQNRCYSLFIFLALVSFYLFCLYSRKRSSMPLYIGLIAVNACLIYTHYFSWLIIFTEICFALPQLKKDRAARAWALTIAQMAGWLLLLFLPWLRNAVYDFKREPIIFYNRPFPGIAKYLHDLYVLVCCDFHARRHPLAALAYIFFLARGWVRIRALDRQTGDHRGILLACFFLQPFLIIYALTLSDRIRYYCPFYFPLSVFLAAGVQGIRWRRLRSVLYPSALAAVVFCNVDDFHAFFTRPLYENWRGAAQIVKRIPDYRNREMVFLFQTRYNPPVFAWYFWDTRLSVAFGNKISAYEGYEKDLRDAGVNSHKVYFISNEAMQADDFMEKLSVFPEDAWIWIFRYHDEYFYNQMRIRAQGKYLVHRVDLDEAIPQIDLFLLKRVD